MDTEEEIPVTTMTEEETPVVAEVKEETPVVETTEATEEEEEKKPSTPSWLQKRIDRVTREKHELRRQLDAALNKPAPAEAGTPEAEVEAKVEKRAREIAVTVASENEFTRACNKVFDEADKEFKDFKENFKTMHQDLGIDMLPRDMVDAVLELEHSAKVLNHLARNVDETARLMELSPTKRAVELGKLDDKINRPVKKISAAPAPVVPVGGNKAPVNGLSDTLSDDEWIARRNKQEEERFAARRGRV